MMRRIVFTDLRRAQKKKSYFICLGVLVVLMVAMAVIATLFPTEGVENGKGLAFTSFSSIVMGLFPFLAGIPVFQTVLSDDFKSRTMQTAIGRGISRRRLVLARFYEIIALLIEAMVVLSILSLGIGMILGAPAGELFKMLGKEWFEVLLTLGYLAIGMLLLYATQNTTTGLVFFILFTANVFSLLLNLLDMIPFLKDNGIKVSSIMPEGVHRNAEQYLFGYTPSASSTDLPVAQDLGKGLLYTAIFIAIYIILPVFLSQVVFRKKELEF